MAASKVRTLLVCVFIGLAGIASAQTVRDPEQHFFQPLLGDLKQELQTARQDGRSGVLLIYEMDDCPFCVRFHRTVLRQSVVQDWFHQRFLVFRIDIKGSNPLVGFDGQDGTEATFAAAQKVRATPTSVFYGLDGREQVRFAGPTRDMGEFLQLGEFVASGAWRNANFVDYKTRTR